MNESERSKGRPACIKKAEIKGGSAGSTVTLGSWLQSSYPKGKENAETGDGGRRKGMSGQERTFER